MPGVLTITSRRCFGPHVVGRDFDTAIDLNDRLNVFKGNSFAKAGIEVAWWTLRSSMENKPLHKLLGGKTREVDSGAAIGIEDSFDVLLGKVQEAVDAGFPRVKLKAAPGWDVDMLRAVRSAFPDIDLHIDAYKVSSSIEVIHAEWNGGKIFLVTRMKSF